MSETENIKYTDEMKARLKGFMGFGTDPVFLFVPSVYREVDEEGNYIIPKSHWPIFKLRGKTGIEVAEEEDNAGYVDPATSKIHLTTGKKRLSLLSKNIIGWKNFRDVETGKEIPCTIVQNEVSNTSLKRLPAPLQVELNEAINEQSKLSEEELLGLEF